MKKKIFTNLVPPISLLGIGRHLLLLLGIFLAFSFQSVYAQTFPPVTVLPAAIPDPGNVSVSVPVTGLSGTVATADEVQINLNIAHAWASDIVVGITPPGGTEIIIVNRIGGGINIDMNSANTLSFRSNASGVIPVPGIDGVIPAGIYLPTGSSGKPVGSFASLIGATRNGTWTIRVRDDDSIIQGILDNASITFFGACTPGTSCDDGDPNTENDMYDSNCICAGTPTCTPTSNTTTETACDSYTWSVNGQTYTESDTYSYTVDCHTETLNLTIVASTSNTTTETVCDSYTWSVNGQTYTESDTYSYTVDCHTETLNLTIVASTSNTTTETACDSYTWSVNGQTYTESDTYSYTVNCHTETLNLTIVASTSNTTTESACNSYTWSVNGETYTESDTYSYTVDCHTETLNLTITNNVTTTTTITACGNYTWAVTGLTYTQPGVYTVIVDDCNTQILDLTIPPGQIASLNGNTNVCAGGVIGLTATGGNQYQWSGPNGYTATGGSITRTNANVTMSGTYTVTITNNECVTILSTTVTVHPNPSATLSGTSSICSGGTITLTAPAGATSYQWSGPGGFSSNTGNTNMLSRTNATTAMAGLYKVTVTNTAGCTATASRNVSVSAPTAATITGATSVCSNTNVMLTATTAGVAYAWTGPGLFTAATAAINTSAVAGQYKVTVTNAAGCISTASKTVTVTAAPTITITNNSNCNRIWLIASGGNSYQWSGPNSYTTSSTTVLRNNPTANMWGTYTVTVTSNGCTSIASVTVSPCGGVSKNAGEELTQNMTVYPNPSNGASTISFYANKEEALTLKVFTADGKEIATLFNQTAQPDTAYNAVFDTTQLPAGTYYTVLRKADGSQQSMPVLVVK